MLYIPKIDDYLEILNDEDVKDFLAIKFSEHFTSIREEKNLRKVTKLPCIFLTTPGQVEKYMQSKLSDNCMHQYNVEILNLFDPELQLITTKAVTENKLKELFNEMERFKIQTTSALDYKE